MLVKSRTEKGGASDTLKLHCIFVT